MSKIEIDGAAIQSLQDFHRVLKNSPQFPSFYGENYSALWDTLTGLVELPLTIVWTNSEISKVRMGEDFDKLTSILRRVEHESCTKPACFMLELR